MPAAVANTVFWLAVVCCAVAQGAIFRSTIASWRRAPGAGAEGAPSLRRSGAAAEVAWAVLPALALAAILAWTWHAMHVGAHETRGARAARATAVWAPRVVA